MPKTRLNEIHKSEVITKYYEIIWSNWKDTTIHHFIITKITKNLNNSRTILYKNIESTTNMGVGTIETKEKIFDWVATGSRPGGTKRMKFISTGC